MSSLSQRELFLEDISQEDLAGVLRLDILLFGRIMIPDSHLFDGCLLLDTFGPQGLVEACGHSRERRTVEIRLRRNDFKESLTLFLMDPATEMLRPIEYRYLRDGEAERQFAARLSEGICVPSGASPSAFLREEMMRYGVEHEVASSLLEAQRAWETDGQKFGLFGRWPRRPFPLAASILESPLPPDAFRSTTGRSAYEALVGLVTLSEDTRSASADATLREHFEGSPNSDAQNDHLVLRDWYHDCRQIAIARQHECSLASKPTAFTHMVPAILRDQADAETPANRAVDIEAVRRIVYVLGSLTAKEYRSLLNHTDALRREWLSARNSRALGDLIAAALQWLRPEQPKVEKPWYQQERIILPTATTVAGMLASGPPVAIMAGLITVGLGSAATRVGDLLTRRGRVRSLVRWVNESSRDLPKS